MAITFLDSSPFVDFLTLRNNIIITANNRIRSHLLRALAVHSTDAPVLVAPQVFTLSQYIDELMKEFEAITGETLSVVGHHQRRYFWQSIIEKNELGQGLLQPKPLAKQADSAFKYLEQWEIPIDTLKDQQFSLGENSQHLLVWIDNFHSLLAQHNLITQETAVARLIEALTNQQLKPKQTALLLGFDDIPPLSMRLLRAAFESFEEHNPNKPSADSVRRFELESQEQEIHYAALWAHQKIAECPEARIGIIVPNLGQCRDQVENIFSRVFAPQGFHPETLRTTPPFNFSAGTPLGNAPIINCAHQLLRLENHPLPLDEMCNLLSSPFFGLDNPTVTSSFIERLRKLERPYISASDLRFQFDKHLNFIDRHFPFAKEEAEQWRTIFSQSATFASLTLKKNAIGYWIDASHQLLSQFGWPGPRQLDSIEHQQVAQWYQLLESLLELDGIQPAVSWLDFINEVTLAAKSTPFQAQTPLSPIQILGALESATLEFDYCWVMGLHNRQWPAAPAPNPFLPIELQRKHQMPHSSAERELLFAQSLTKHYLSCASEVVLSSPSWLDDQELHPSALIKHIPTGDCERDLQLKIEGTLHPYIYDLHKNRQLETLMDDQGPPLTLHEKIRGGASLLKEQAACPFNAFARFRLGADNPETPIFGISYRDRGNLLHNTLAGIWRRLKNQAQLVATTNEELNLIIDEHLSPQLNSLAIERGLTAIPLYLDVEYERTKKLITQWLQVEKSREYFEVISIEEPIQIVFEGIPMNLRLDRIDKLANGDLMLIDYKTGSPSIKDWSGERPKDPQLPLYVLVSNPQPKAITFARISATACEFIGVGQAIGQPISLKQVEDWDQETQQWHTTLTQLAEEFVTGQARVEFNSEEAKRHSRALTPLNRHLAQR